MMGAEKILILGGGESGVGAALLAKKVGFEPLVSEHGLLKELYRSELQVSKKMAMCWLFSKNII